MHLDHVLFAVSDLDEGARRLRDEYGLDSVEGGRHAGLGTGNRIVPLGPSYLELIAVVDPEEAAAGPLGQWVAGRVGEGGGPVGWVVAPDRFDATCARLGLEPVEMSRPTPEGVELSWRLAGLVQAMTEPPLPAFIEWDVAPQHHPGRAPARHRVAPHGIAAIELAGDRDRLAEWLGGLSLPIHFAAEGPPGVRAVEIAVEARALVVR